MSAVRTRLPTLAWLVLCVLAPASAARTSALIAPELPAKQDALLVAVVPESPLLLGDRFLLIVSGGLDEDSRLVVDALPEGLQAGRVRTERTPDGLELHLPLRALREGELRVDGLAVVTADGERAVPRVDIRVTLDLPPGRMPRVADPLGPVSVPMPPADLLPFLIGLSVALVALCAYAALVGRRIPPPPKLRRPPELIAIEAFAHLRTHLPSTREDVPAFVITVSGVLRTYIEEVFAVRAPESTTEEFLFEVAARHDALAQHQQVLGGFLQSCDLVKFAGHRPEPSTVEPLLVTAEEFVEATHA